MFLQPKSRLALVFPIGAVVEAARGFAFGYGLLVVFGHPAVDVVEQSRLVPQGFALTQLLASLHSQNG